MTDNQKIFLKAENLLNGKAVAVNDNDEAAKVINFVSKEMSSKVTGEQIVAMTKSICVAPHTIRYLDFYTAHGNYQLVMLLQCNSDTDKFNLFSEDGIFSYIYDYSLPCKSDFAYTKYVQYNRHITRIL